MKFISTERGFGMIEAMIAIGVIAVAMLAYATQTSNQVASQNSIHSVTELQSTVEEIQQAFAAAGICKANLQNLTFNKSSLNPANTYPDLTIAQVALPSATSSPLATTGAALKNLPGSVVSMALIEVRQLVADSLYSGKIRFSLVKNANVPSSVGGPNTIYRDMPLTLSVTASGTTETIQDCFTGSQTTSASIAGNDVGKWVGSGVMADPGVTDCTSGLSNAVRGSGTPLSVTGNCMPVGMACKIPGAYAGQYFLETCTGAYSDASAPGGGGGGEGGDDGGGDGD